jgi:hypothetical protein
MAHSTNISFNDEIPMNEFNEFLDILEKVDNAEYETEKKDGFVDLYNYWTGAGHRRFEIKLVANRNKLQP